MSIVFAFILLVAPLLGSSPSAAVTGGPDSYGYVWVDSRTPSPVVTYNYIEISSTGSKLTLPDDGCTFEVGLNFQFRFYGTIIDSVFVCSNGFITFAVPDSFLADPPIPDPAAPNYRIVALGVDLNPAAEGSGSVYVRSYPSSTPRRFVIAWDRVYKAYTTQTESFEIVLEQNELWKDGRIVIQYKALNDIASMPLVGIENATGSSGLVYPGPLGNQLAVAFLPPTDAALPPDQLRVSASSIAPPTAAQGGIDIPMMQLDLSVPTNDVLVKAVEVTLSGLRAGVEDVRFARLWLDDGDGTFNAGLPDLAIAESRFGDVSLVARLSCAVQVTMAATVRLFVSYDLESTAGIDDWIGARISGASSISVEYPDTVSSIGLPSDTYAVGVRTKIVASQDTLMLTGHAPLAPSSAARWATDVPMLSMRLDADRNMVDLAGIEVALGGNAAASDVWAVKALRDLDEDGNYTPGTDVVLALKAPSGSPAIATLDFSLTVFSGSPETILILIDVAPFAIIGRILNPTVVQSGMKLPGGSVDIVSGTNFPVAGGQTMIVAGQRPALNVSWSESGPRPDGVWMADEYLLDPSSTVFIGVPAGNGVPGYMTMENNYTHIFIAVDVANGLAPAPADGVAFGFDTDQDGAPTTNADDAFAVNATEGWHLKYSSGTWISTGSCLEAPPAGDITVPSCVAGTGATAFSATPHRFYEFAIPLTFLGVSVPVAPGTILRFALAAPPYNGLLSTGSRSTWPLVFAPLPPLTHFGNLALSAGATPNRPPALDWVGETGYAADGLEPEFGGLNDTFLWRISYSDEDNNPPAYGQPLLHVLDDNVEIAGGPFAMAAEDPDDRDFRDGNAYARSLAGLECGGAFTYYFSVRDARGLANSTPSKAGPVVDCPDEPPVLLGGTVSPIQGITGDMFTYRVVYQDPEGDAPTSINVSISIGDVSLTTIALTNIGWVSDPGNYSAGALFGASIVLGSPGLNYSYQFAASDENNTVLSVIFFGPYVLSKPPDTLSVAGVDLAPIAVNEGARRAPFLQLFLFTSDPWVNVTGIRVDIIGTAGDMDVDDVLMYNDTDSSGTVTGSDQLLGSFPPSSGVVDFAVSLQVTKVATTSLIFLVDFARPGTADATAGLELKDSSYVAVEPSGYVQPFMPIRSTRALINVPPDAFDLTVDGNAEMTEGIGHILTTAPIFEWRFDDANGGDPTQAAYNVSVSLVSPPALVWFQNDTGDTNSVAYTGPSINPGTAYLMSVSLSDGEMWSAPAGIAFRRNTPPPFPPQISPSNGTTGLDPNVTLTWQTVVDAEGDLVTYHYWVWDAGLETQITDSSTGQSVTVALAEGTTYFWKLGVTDGWEYRGNETVWHFSTSGTAPPPDRGEVRGRVIGNGAPLLGALVELLADSIVVRANITGADGTFRFLSVDLRLYTVRVSAFGYETKTLAAEPKPSQAVVDLGDISLASAGDGGTYALPAWLLILVAALGIGLGAFLSILALWLLRRRKKGTEVTVMAAEQKAGIIVKKKPEGGKAPAIPREKGGQRKAVESGKSRTASATAKGDIARKPVKPVSGKAAAIPVRKNVAPKASTPGKGQTAVIGEKKNEAQKTDEPGKDNGKA